MPFSDALSMGTPSTGSTVCAAQTPARCAAPPAAAMITSMPRASAWLTYSAVSCGRAMRRKHAAFVRHAELREHLVGLAHGFPVRLAAHDDRYQRVAVPPCVIAPVPACSRACRRNCAASAVAAISMPAAATRPSSADACWPCRVAPSAMKRQRKLSVQNVSARARRPDLDAAIVDHLQAEAVARELAHRRGQIVGIARRPVDEDVDALQFHLAESRLPASRRSAALPSAAWHRSPASGVLGFWPRRAITAAANSLVPTFCVLTPSVKMS